MYSIIIMMYVSVFELFKIGIGPSSSHTVGPMVAAKQFLEALARNQSLDKVQKLTVELYGSLALTGVGHGTDIAVVLGLMGHEPSTVDTDMAPIWMSDSLAKKSLSLLGQQTITFDPARDIKFLKKSRKPYHTNALTFTAVDATGNCLSQETIYSVGGGQIVWDAHKDHPLSDIDHPVPYLFQDAGELLEFSETHDMTIPEIIWANECANRSETDILTYLNQLWSTMKGTVQKGFVTEGILPGGLFVKRRAPELRKKLETSQAAAIKDPAEVFDWLSVFALSTNEENAAGGRVVTAPTNGAAGIVPAVLHYIDQFVTPVTDDVLKTFFFTATAIGGLYQKNASISGAEMGCQGEVGVASSMAAGALCAVRGGSTAQIENAAEIAMEHHLGLTCDPIKGLVQVPCIERNTMGAIKAVNASRLALSQDGTCHIVSLDKVIRTMKKTGEDMRKKYKETAQGGLAVHVPEC